MDPHDGLLTLNKVVKHFDISGGLLDQLRFENGRLTRHRTTVKAVNNVSFTIAPGETFSVVGESGCGKSTLARTTLGIYPPNRGQILYRGERIDNKNAQQMLPYRRKMQMIFQDPYESLNPRRTDRGAPIGSPSCSPVARACARAVASSSGRPGAGASCATPPKAWPRYARSVA